MPAGRPSKYKPEYADIAYETMAEGYSKTATAGKLGICRDTLYQWCEDHPEFSYAVKRGEMARTLKLEEMLLKAPDGPTVTSRIFALKNAAPDEWRDVHERKVSGTVNHKHTVADDVADFTSRISGLASRTGTREGTRKPH